MTTLLQSRTGKTIPHSGAVFFYVQYAKQVQRVLHVKWSNHKSNSLSSLLFVFSDVTELLDPQGIWHFYPSHLH